MPPPLLSRLLRDATEEEWLCTDRGVDPAPRPYGVQANEPMDSASDRDRYEAMDRTIAAALGGCGGGSRCCCCCGCGCDDRAGDRGWSALAIRPSIASTLRDGTGSVATSFAAAVAGASSGDAVLSSSSSR